MSTWSVDGMCLDAERWAKFMGYPSARHWAKGSLYEGRTIRGCMRRGKYRQPCNAVAGEIG